MPAAGATLPGGEVSSHRTRSPAGEARPRGLERAVARLAARRPRTPGLARRACLAPSPPAFIDDAGGLHVAGIGSHEGTRRRPALRRPLVRARRRRAGGPGRPQRRGQVDAAAAAGRCRSARPRRGRHRRRRAHRLAAPGGPGSRARPSASCSAPGWASCGPCAASCSALLARLAEGDTSPATLERYGHAQERFEALGGWALEASLDEARRALAIDHLDADTPLARLSGGEQARALLAGTLLAAPTVLLLDEPTNHLDGDGLQWLEDWLRGFPGTVVVVSHDRAFLDAVVGCILELEPGGALTRYEGGYSDHRAERERRRAKLALDYEAQEKRRRRLEADIATTRRQAQHTENTVSRAAAPKLKRYAKKVARKAKAREGRLRRELEGDACDRRARRAPGAAPAPARPRARAPAHRGVARRALARRWPRSSSRCIAATASR